MTEESIAVRISPNLGECINYASWQNSVPLLKSLEIANESKDVVRNLELDLHISPGFARPKKWIIQSLNPGQRVFLTDRDIQLDPEYLNGLNEAERGVATFDLAINQRHVLQETYDLRVLARDEWGGMGSAAELLAAFVMPNDPAISRLLKESAQVLEKHGQSSALDGYQSGDPHRAYLLTAAVWSVVVERSFTYANPPSSFEKVGQKTRRPTQILSEGLGTCLDLTLLFAATIEALGLHPVIVMTQGHCFVGVWLVEQTQNRLIEKDCTEIRKAIAAKELITFETTLVTQRPTVDFNTAIQAARDATQESREHEFVAAIDVKRARMAQIRPLASHDSSTLDDPDFEGHSGPLPLPSAPDFSQLPVQTTEEKPTTAAGRIDRWQRKLLDLSLRNRLLNFKATKQSVPLLCSDISELEDKLAGGSKLRIISLKEHSAIGERDTELHRQRTKQDLETEFIRQALDRNEIACNLEGAELDKRLTSVYRKVRNDLAEGGSNTLFLAVGFLKWKQKREDEKSYRAPLLLVPVKLTRKSALSPFQLTHHEDDVRFNATLIQLLKKDFDRDLGRLETELPCDESGVDVPLILDTVRAEVRDVPGFEVVEELALGTFSFAKYLMWKDLVDRSDQLENNRVVRHLIRNPDEAYDSGCGAIPRPQEIDSRYDPKEIFHPLPADSSQLSAVMSASEGHDFVLVGPPGTGKSQTIANIIAQCLAMRKTVLFVAEKTAALDVVYRRLRQHGLGNCCVELHSNKAERRHFLDQLKAAWEHNRRPQQNEWVQISAQLKIRRDQLNGYVTAIHHRHPNGWSAYRAMGLCVKGRDWTTPELNWPPLTQHSQANYDELENIVQSLALKFTHIDPAATLTMIRHADWSVSWQSELLKCCAEITKCATKLLDSLIKFWDALGISSREDCTQDELVRLIRLAEALAQCGNEDFRVIFNKKFNRFPDATTQLEGDIERYFQARKSMSANYDETLDQIPVEDLDQHWRQATASLWPFSWFAKRKLTRLLQSYAASGQATPEADLKAIQMMRDGRDAIHDSLLAEQTSHWKAQETNIKTLKIFIDQAQELRQAIMSLGQPLGKTNEISKAIYPEIAGTNENSAVLQLIRSFLTDAMDFQASVTAFAKVAGGPLINDDTQNILMHSIETAKLIQEHQTQLQSWTSWCQTKESADKVGLGGFVTGLENQDFSSADLVERFRLAYARWWIRGVIDNDVLLRTFQRFEHEACITQFRKLDEQARETASVRAREAIAHNLPGESSVPRKSELGLLRHQMNLKRPSKSIRDVIGGMSQTFDKLAPCLLMSPLSIAQYLPVGQALFDVVIFDEASQITTWDAIGAIARARQTIIVGDPKQLPPTNFFGRIEDDEANDELEDHERDLESILDEAKASGLPTLMLNWHYRSRHESLIAFSNWNYYDNKLVTFPSAESDDRGVKLKHLTGAVYDRGKSRTNRKEADAIVDDVVQRMLKNLALPEEERLTYGVVTFNMQQQTLIQDLLDDAQRQHPELDWYFSDDRVEPTVVKNLENVQGDERDVMLFSITFGRDESGRTMSRNFGALNRDGGERRLNVAVTRARQELIVYSSFRGDDLSLEGIQARGVKDLKNFLEYAEKGPLAIISRSDGSVGDFESPFEEAVAEALTSTGWEVVPQVGVSGFRIDLGITHPQKPGSFLAGIECDGATYHSSAAARDRDKTRQLVLENLGWNILRIWSRDWWHDPDQAIEHVDQHLSELLNFHIRNSREKNENNPASAKPTSNTVIARNVTIPSSNAERTSNPSTNSVANSNAFLRIELPDQSEHQDKFFEMSYAAQLRSLALQILENEAPIRDDLLARRIAKSHGFARTGGNIRDHILSIVDDFPCTDESSGRFLWAGSPQQVLPFRYAEHEDDRRAIDEISLAELRGLVSEHKHFLNEDDPALLLSRAMGIGRLSRSARERIDEAIAACQEGLE